MQKHREIPFVWRYFVGKPGSKGKPSNFPVVLQGRCQLFVCKPGINNSEVSAFLMYFQCILLREGSGSVVVSKPDVKKFRCWVFLVGWFFSPFFIFSHVCWSVALYHERHILIHSWLFIFQKRFVGDDAWKTSVPNWNFARLFVNGRSLKVRKI